MKKNRILLFLLAGVLMFSCNNIPDNLKIKTNSYHKKIKDSDSTILVKEQEFAAYLQTRPYLLSSVKSEDLFSNFEASKEYIKEAKSFYNIADSIADDNNGDNTALLKSYHTKIDNKLNMVKSAIKHPINRSRFLEKLYKETDAYKLSVENKMTYINETQKDLIAISNKYSNAYPKKDSLIKKDLKSITLVYDMDKKIEKDFFMHYELKKSKSDSFNLIVMANSYTNIKKDYDFFKNKSKSHPKKLAELDDSYTKTLVDMDAKFYVQVGRSSWDESSDYGEKDRLYSFVEVSEQCATYFDKLPENTVLAKYNKGWSSGWSLTVKMTRSYWDDLKIKGGESWPDKYHDHSEFWFNDSRVDYYHKYNIEKNGKVIENGWVKVDEDTFYDNLENIGMAIETKPYGYFNYEAIDVATPPGMAYVGDNKYGKWKTKDSGDRFWVFYAKWHFYNTLFNGHYYTYGMYTDYRTNYYGRSKSYYGTGSRRYGTTGNIKSKRYAISRYSKKFSNNSRSQFSKSGVRSYSRSQASVRSGNSHRGGGPGGGGK